MSLSAIAMFVYTVILKPRPLRWITNTILLLLIPKQVRIAEGVLNLHPNDPVISGALALGVYENYQLDLFRSVVHPGMTVLDVGANIGLYTVVAARLAGEQGMVVSFEPEQQNFGILQKNISDNGFKKVVLVQVAVADSEGEVALNISKDNKGNHSVFALSDAEGEQIVRTISMDNWLEKNTIGKVDVIKMDIQGSEPLAFVGMKKTLANKPLLFVEYDPRPLIKSGYKPIEMLNTLQGYGYTLYVIDEGTKSKKKINDIQSFADTFHGNYANLLCE